MQKRNNISRATVAFSTTTDFRANETNSDVDMCVMCVGKKQEKNYEIFVEIKAKFCSIGQKNSKPIDLRYHIHRNTVTITTQKYYVPKCSRASCEGVLSMACDSRQNVEKETRLDCLIIFAVGHRCRALTVQFTFQFNYGSGICLMFTLLTPCYQRTVVCCCC